MYGQEYVTSERFIHDSIVESVTDNALPTLYKSWSRDQKIDPFFVAWPMSRVDPCQLNLSKDKSTWVGTMCELIEATHAYAILLTETVGDKLRVIFESPHGTRCWTFPIKDYGNITGLGKPTVSDDKESIGILWRRRTAVA